MSYCSSSQSLLFSKDQDSFNNIVIEENKSNIPNSSKSFSNFDEEEIIFNQDDTSQEDMEFEDNQNIDRISYEQQDKAQNELQQTSIILKKIQEKKKNIFQLIHKTQLKNIQNSGQSRHFSSTDEQKSNLIFKREIFNYSRREKSLEELSKKFLSLFLDKDESLLSLDKITNQLGVERRRIYDIINILESLKLVSRQGKNNYKWNGFKKIYGTINQFDNNSIQFKEEQESTQEPQKREKSLEMLSIGFLKLFLHWKHTMTLEEAARKLSLKMIDDHKIKTKIRRLYDIANVFKSLGLIKKTSLTETKKPAFEWVGIEGLNLFVQQIMNKNNSRGHLEIKEDQIDDKNSILCSQVQLQQSSQSMYEPFISKRRLQSDQLQIQINSPEENGQNKQLKKSFILHQQMKEQQEKSRQNIEISQNNQQLCQQNNNSNSNNQNTKQQIITNSSSNTIDEIPTPILKICQNFTNQQLSQKSSSQNNNFSLNSSIFQNNTQPITQSQLQLFSRNHLEQPSSENNQNKVNLNLDDNLNNNSNFNSNLLENLMMKCFQNVLSNFLTKNMTCQQQNINSQQNINEQSSNTEKQQNLIQDQNSLKQGSILSYQNENEDIYQKINKLNQQNNINLTKSPVKKINNSYYDQNMLNGVFNSSNQKTLLSCKKINNSSQKYYNNLSNFTTAKKSKEDMNQTINDENIPISGEKSRLSQLQNQLSFSNLKNNNLKTPVLKKALTIIQPRLEEYEDVTPTPPQLKRSFSVYHQQGNTTASNNKNKYQNSNMSRVQLNLNYSSIFTDKTNNQTQIVQNNLNENNSDIFQQSSFKKIRKLTYENNLLDESDNKQNNQIRSKQITFNTLLQNSYSQMNNNNYQDAKENSNNLLNSLQHINNLNILQNKNIFQNSN